MDGAGRISGEAMEEGGAEVEEGDSSSVSSEASIMSETELTEQATALEATVSACARNCMEKTASEGCWVLFDAHVSCFVELIHCTRRCKSIVHYVRPHDFSWLCSCMKHSPCMMQAPCSCVCLCTGVVKLCSPAGLVLATWTTLSGGNLAYLAFTQNQTLFD